MKRILKIFLGVVLGIFLLLLILPFAFKGQIETKVKEEINNQVNANVNYESFTLSFLKGFPDIYIGLNGLSVVGHAPFENDTLLSLGKFSTEVDLFSAISGEVVVKSVLLDQMHVNAIVLADSTANWDIAKASEEEVVVEEDSDGESSSFKVVLKSFVIRDANIAYTDNTMALKSEIKGFQLDLSGDMSESITNIQVDSDVEGLYVDFEGMKYLKGASLGLNAGVKADLENMIFTFLENELSVNRLALQMDGTLEMKEESYVMDLSLGTKNTDFKSILALIPEAYMTDYEALKTSGNLDLLATVKGEYVDEEHLPAFDIRLNVADGMIQYPDLPKSIDDINVKLNVNNPGGSPDATVTNLEQFHFELAGNPFDAQLGLTTPISNLTYTGLIKGKIDFSSLADAIPMDSIDIQGLVAADITLDGDYEMVEREAYDEIEANGNVNMTDFYFNSKDMAHGVLISDAQLLLTPRFVSLESFDSKIGQSDFKLKGKLENYLAYALSDGVLKGKLNHKSNYINSNEFMVESEVQEVSVEDTTSLEIIAIPTNLDFVLTSDIDRLLYDKLNIEHTKGKIVIKEGSVVLDGLNMNLLGGDLNMTGQYNTSDIEKPFVDFDFVGRNIDINKAANSFSVIDSMLPLAKNAVGIVSPKFKYYSELKEDFKPVMSSIDGGGNIKSKGVEISGSKIQNGIAAMVKDERYKVMKAEDLNINFKIDKGNVIVEPFKTKVYGKEIEVQGTQGVDQSIDYKITMPVARQEVAVMAGLMGMNLPTSGDDLMVDVIVKGTVQEPALSLNLDKAKAEVGNELGKEAEKAVKKLLEDPDTQKKVDELTKKFKNIFK
ncbi:AsmA-like C-terminal region-containing protein [Carboxylicivirga sp. N1Y90]|uniref:AsmA-like C-terminal region-containing protein n=1 Tax=Carboxylicivirga fragile TaxID=3417571 RepID=UPI003D338C0E|nr:AsmA family protein [Marinilabiliaceae bacterium N1Y90]